MNLKENTPSERLLNGLIKENPTFVLMLGMCPTLAVTTSAINGMGMGLTTMVVLALSNMLISLLRGIIPDKVRIPAFIVVIATFVTVVELLLKAYLPFLYDALGLYIPLIVVNCIILGRAEAYASKFKVVLSIFDGIGMGLGFTAALTVIGAIREVLGAGELFGNRVMPAGYVPNSIFVLAPGAFLVLACLTAIQNRVKRLGEKKGKDMSRIQSGCNADCMNCGDSGCSRRVFGEAEDTLEIIEITDDYEDLRISDENQPALEADSPGEVPGTKDTEFFDWKVEWKDPKIVMERNEDTIIIGAVEGPTSVFLATKAGTEEKVKADHEMEAETEGKAENKASAETEVKAGNEASAGTEVKAGNEAKAGTKRKAETKARADAKAKTPIKEKKAPKSKTGAKVKSDAKPENNREKEERRDD